MTSNQAPAVELIGLHKTFQEGDRTRTVLADVSQTFAHGQFTALLGASGSGKSTLLNLISGIEMPTSGEIRVAGQAVTRMNDKQRTLFRRGHIGFIFQFFNLIPTLTVLENVTLPLELAGTRRMEAASIGKELLGRVGLHDRLTTFPDKLSGGEQQRVAIARALASDPALVLADEPTGNLDAKTGDHVLALLLELTREAGKTMIMATHSTKIAPLADRIFRVADGALTLN